MEMPIWQATAAGPVDITISVDADAHAWFRLTDNGTVVFREIDNQNATGACHVRVTPTDEQDYVLQVLCQSAATSADVTATVMQNGVNLPCYGDDGTIANSDGDGGYVAVQLGTLTPGQSQIFNFDLWPAGGAQ